MPLGPHSLKLVLVHPQIAPNTGNIARLCVATGTELHIVRPMGFVLSDRQLKRSAMDYWPRLKLTVHDDLDAFLAVLGEQRAWLLENGTGRTIWDADFADGDWLLLGSETFGLPKSLRERFATRLVEIPQVEGERCLNVSTAAGIALFTALRKIQ
jgi:tRNA (cytidine/uridine-2'-O-)-methyltransferase